MDLRGIWTNFNTTITAFESSYEFLPQPTVPRDNMTHTPKLQFADPREQEDLPIEILVGGDHYWKIVKDSPPLPISPSVVLLPSNLGRILAVHFIYGALVRYRKQRSGGSRIWKLSASHPTRTKDSTVLQVFHDSFRTDDSRRDVCLPKEKITFPTNRQNAENRFRLLETRLRKNANLRHVYI
jgi:hypothetical protein